ncbi:MAG: Imm51 family immunity protein [Flavobacteriales bacterium]|nr:Imm51 family immunity protein [Flavobacteriales bacterium]
MKQINFPENLKFILREEGLYEDDSHDPFSITVMESEYKGKDTICYQVEFDASDSIGHIGNIVKAKGLIVDGDGWENYLRQYIAHKERGLEKKIIGDSEASTCVLWTKKEQDFKKMMSLIFKFFYDKSEVTDIS